jgi:hypothetical protein
MLKITTKLGEKKRERERERERDKFNTTTLEKNFRRKKKLQLPYQK